MRKCVALVGAPVVAVSTAGVSQAQAADPASSSPSAKWTATLNAASDLYGAGSTQYNTVAAAWSAVAVS